ncbi:hypothetical protein [Sporichthya polymorpha]|uniref:hypothetical protein n=1 Tax=Sporichthya polymorpha TaxID=35751 RepID=UPI000360C3B7|nr:hypothetical protein [Sporichthya polymorpha]
MGYATEQMLVVAIVLGLLVLVLRWAFSPRQTSLLSRRPRTGSEHDYGLMTPLAAPEDAAEGAQISALLARSGIRSRVVETEDGLRVMVWDDDLQRARELLLGY